MPSLLVEKLGDLEKFPISFRNQRTHTVGDAVEVFQRGIDEGDKMFADWADEFDIAIVPAEGSVVGSIFPGTFKLFAIAFPTATPEASHF